MLLVVHSLNVKVLIKNKSDCFIVPRLDEANFEGQQMGQQTGNNMSRGEMTQCGMGNQMRQGMSNQMQGNMGGEMPKHIIRVVKTGTYHTNSLKCNIHDISNLLTM